MRKLFSRTSKADRSSAADNPFTDVTDPNDNPFGGGGNNVPAAANEGGGGGGGTIWAASSRDSTASARDSFADAPMPRKSLTLPGKMSSLLAGDPDKNHDKKMSGIAVDQSVTAAKSALRKLRDSIESTAVFYGKYAERKRGAATGHLPLVLPEMAEWSRHEAFCGAHSCGELLYRNAARLAAIEELLNAERTAIAYIASATLRGEAKALCDRGLSAVYGLELELREASQAREAAAKALKKGTANRESALADERKAQAIKDESKRPAAQAAAQRALEKAAGEVSDAEGALARADAEIGRLTREAQPVALEQAAAARREAQSGPLSQAVDALAAAYRAFAEGSVAALRGEGPSSTSTYTPTAKMRKAPKEAGSSRFAACVVQWTLAKRRGKAAAALAEDFVKAGLETLLSPAKEAATLAALAAECEDTQLVQRLHALPLGEATHAAACSALRTALGAFVTTLGAFRVTMKAQVARVEDYDKREKALKALRGKRDDTDKEVQKLQGQAEGRSGDPKSVEKAVVALDKRRTDLAKLEAEVGSKMEALERTAAELETFSSELGADDGPHSITRLVGVPVGEAVRAYLAFCATRVEGAPSGGGAGSDAPLSLGDGGLAGAPFGGGGGGAAEPAFGAEPAWGSQFSQDQPPAWAAGFTEPSPGAAAPGYSGAVGGSVDVSDNPFLSNSPGPSAGWAGAGDAPFQASGGQWGDGASDPFANGGVGGAGGGVGGGDGGPLSQPLPPGWYSAVDPSTADTYYVSPGGETTWTAPVVAPQQDGGNPFL